MDPTLASPDAALAAATSTNSQLCTHLDQARTELHKRKRQRQLADERAHAQTDEAQLARERDLRERLHSLRHHLAQKDSQSTVADRVRDALDHSHLVSSHLSSLSPAVPPSQSQADLAAVLAQRDTLALAVLDLTKDLASLTSQRAQLRRELLRLNRRNAAHVAALRASHALATPAARRTALRALPAPLAEYHARLQTELPTLQARVAILQGVLVRLIAESGIVLALPPDESLGASPGELDDDPDAVWDAQRVWRVLHFAGAGADLLSGDGAGDPHGSCAWEDGQVLPDEVSRRVREAERAVAGAAGAAGGSERKGGGGTPGKGSGAGKAAKGRSRTVG